MRMPYPVGLALSLLAGSSVGGLCAQAPRNVGVTFDGETDAIEPLAKDEWHTITASYRYEGNISLLTNTYLVIARGSDQLSGFYVGYHLPTNQLAIVKHGYWNATEATGRARGPLASPPPLPHLYRRLVPRRLIRPLDALALAGALVGREDDLHHCPAVFAGDEGLLVPEYAIDEVRELLGEAVGQLTPHPGATGPEVTSAFRSGARATATRRTRRCGWWPP